MKIRPVLFIALLAFLILPASLCAAEITEEDMALGGIRIGMTIEEVEELYGEPEDFEDAVMPRQKGEYAVRTYDYGDTFCVTFLAAVGEDYTVGSVYLGAKEVNEYNRRPTERACTFKTPRGIHLSSTPKDLEAAYGCLPKPEYSNHAPPICTYTYETDATELTFSLCGEYSPGFRAICLYGK